MTLGNMREQGVTSPASGRHISQLRVSTSAPRIQFCRSRERAVARQGPLCGMRVAGNSSNYITLAIAGMQVAGIGAPSA
jgi:hypothetical protein